MYRLPGVLASAKARLLRPCSCDRGELLSAYEQTPHGRLWRATTLSPWAVKTHGQEATPLLFSACLGCGLAKARPQQQGGGGRRQQARSGRAEEGRARKVACGHGAATPVVIVVLLGVARSGRTRLGARLGVILHTRDGASRLLRRVASSSRLVLLVHVWGAHRGRRGAADAGRG